MQITNYELGILIPLRTEAEIERLTCWERPAQKYVLGRDEPWVSRAFDRCLWWHIYKLTDGMTGWLLKLDPIRVRGVCGGQMRCGCAIAYIDGHVSFR